MAENNDDFVIYDAEEEQQEETIKKVLEEVNPTNGIEETPENSEDNEFLTPDEIEALATGKPVNTKKSSKDESAEKKPKKTGFLLNKIKKEDANIVSTKRNSSIKKTSIARTVVIDFLEGTTKKSEAMAYARGFIDNHYQAPSACFIYVVSYEGVYAVEIHDGGDGKPYLPSVVKALEDDASACVCIENRRRTLEIKRNDKGVFSSILLPEAIDSTETNIIRIEPDSKSNMRPYSFRTILFAFISMSLCLLGFTFLLLTSIVALFSYQRPVKILKTTKINQLPIQQWDNLINSYTEELYVEKLTYSDKRWKVAQRKIPFSEVKEQANVDALTQKVTKQVREEVRDEIKSGVFLTEEEKTAIRRHLTEKIIETVEESGDLSLNSQEESVAELITPEEVKEEIIEIPPMEDLSEIRAIEEMPPMEDYRFEEPDMMEDPESRFNNQRERRRRNNRNSEFNPDMMEDPMYFEEMQRQRGMDNGFTPGEETLIVE